MEDFGGRACLRFEFQTGAHRQPDLAREVLLLGGNFANPPMTLYRTVYQSRQRQVTALPSRLPRRSLKLPGPSLVGTACRQAALLRPLPGCRSGAAASTIKACISLSADPLGLPLRCRASLTARLGTHTRTVLT